MTFVRKLLAIVAFAAIAACRGDTAVSPTSLAGTWTLVGVNGAALPYAYPIDATGVLYELLDDQIVVTSDNKFKEQGHQRSTDRFAANVNPRIAYEYPGVYTVSGNNVSFVFQGGATGTATVTGASMRGNFEGQTFTYSKQ